MSMHIWQDVTTVVYKSDSVMAYYSDNSECGGQKKHEVKVWRLKFWLLFINL